MGPESTRREVISFVAAASRRSLHQPYGVFVGHSRAGRREARGVCMARRAGELRNGHRLRLRRSQRPGNSRSSGPPTFTSSARRSAASTAFIGPHSSWPLAFPCRVPCAPTGGCSSIRAKMSKSRGNIVGANEVHEVLGADALRYFLPRDSLRPGRQFLVRRVGAALQQEISPMATATSSAASSIWCTSISPAWFRKIRICLRLSL